MHRFICLDGTLNAGPGRLLRVSFSVLYPGLSRRCLETMNSIILNILITKFSLYLLFSDIGTLNVIKVRVIFLTLVPIQNREP